MIRRHWRNGAVVLLAGALVAAAGCGDDDGGDASPAPSTTTASTTAPTTAPAPDAGEQAAGTYVGTVEETGAYVAIVVSDDGDAIAYITDGADSVDWLGGFIERDGAAVLGNDGGAIMDVTFADGGTSGTFKRPDDPPGRFTASAAEAPAGVYRAEETFADGLYVAGWVVLDDGSQRGSIRRYETPLPRDQVVPDLDVAHPTTLAVDVPGGVLRPAYVDPAHLPALT